MINCRFTLLFIIGAIYSYIILLNIPIVLGLKCRLLKQEARKHQKDIITALNQPQLKIKQWTRQTTCGSQAEVLWKTTPAFLKCVPSIEDVDEEILVFNRLKDAQKLYRGKNIIGINRVQQPLYMASIDDYTCFIYTYGGSWTIRDFFKYSTWEKKVKYLPQIMYQLLEGIAYLNDAGISHGDINDSNIMIQVLARSTKIAITIIDYDICTLLTKQFAHNAQFKNDLSLSSIAQLQQDMLQPASLIGSYLTGISYNMAGDDREIWQRYIHALLGSFNKQASLETNKLPYDIKLIQILQLSDTNAYYMHLKRQFYPIVKILNKMLPEHLEDTPTAKQVLNSLPPILPSAKDSILINPLRFVMI
ncbi:hypothetical protein BDF19DRAFT_180612 [Syncephalis fuscata]|nr:hypothetical protein BDF19DRAFT_180612 [Syncephalis fuscata]